jgi:hypothetical protein
MLRWCSAAIINRDAVLELLNSRRVDGNAETDGLAVRIQMVALSALAPA